MKVLAVVVLVVLACLAVQGNSTTTTTLSPGNATTTAAGSSESESAESGTTTTAESRVVRNAELAPSTSEAPSSPGKLVTPSSEAGTGGTTEVPVVSTGASRERRHLLKKLLKKGVFLG